MAIESLPIYSILSGLVRRLPSFFLKRHYTAERLGQLIYLDIQPRGDSVALNLGQITEAQVVLQLINLSPFSVEIDRAKFEFICLGAPIELTNLDRKVIEPGEITNLLLRGPIPHGAANLIANSPEKRVSGWLNGNIEFNSGVRNFGKRIGSLMDIYPRVVNVNARMRSE